MSRLVEKVFGRKHGRKQTSNTTVRFEADGANCTQLSIVRQPPEGTVSDTSSVGSDITDAVVVKATSRSCDDLLTQPVIACSQSALDFTVTETNQVVSGTGQVVSDKTVRLDTTGCINQDVSDAVIADDVPANVMVDAVPETSSNRATEGTQASAPISALQPLTVNVIPVPTAFSGNSEVSQSDHFDLFIITSDDDQENAIKLAELLVKFCTICLGYPLTIHPELQFGQNKLDHLRSGLARSNYKFIFIGDGFRECDLVKFETDAALMQMIYNHDQSIIPVRAHSGIAMPSLLRMFRSLDLHKLLYGKRLDDVDVKTLVESDIDRGLLANITKMVTKTVPGTTFKLPAGDHCTTGTCQHSEILRKHYRYLVDTMDPDNGLLTALYAGSVIGHREMERVRSEKTFYDRNEYLIRLLMRKTDSDFTEFIAVLRSTEQDHIADVLCSEGKQLEVR